METKSRHTMTKKEKLGVFDILKEALTIPYKHINFFIFTIIISLPLFCFLVYYETLLLSTLVETSKILLTIPSYRYNYNWPIPDDRMTRQFNKDFGYKLLQLGLLYMVPLYLLELFSMLVIIDLASNLYTEERSMSLKEMLNKPISKATFRGTFITSVYVFFLSTCHVLGLIWLATNYFAIFRNFSFYLFFALLYGVSFVALLAKYLEWSAMWNMSVVISILEEIYGVEALALSAYFNRGSEQHGQLLMLLFFVWGLVLRLSCLFLSCHERGHGIIVQILFSGMGTVVKWVACMVYFYDCKKRILQKKVDEEVGVLVEVVDE